SETHDQPQGLQLHHRLAQAEGGEDRPPATVHRPANDRALGRLQDRVDVRVGDLDPAGVVEVDLLFEELAIGVRHAANLIGSSTGSRFASMMANSGGGLTEFPTIRTCWLTLSFRPSAVRSMM